MKSRTIVIVLIGALLLPAVLHSQLRLSMSVEKESFFEAEPIYTVIELTNSGSDTVWTSWFPLVYRRLSISLVRDGSERVHGNGLVVDPIVPDNWRGIPLPPGAAAYEGLVLQVWWGEDAGPTGLFRRRLPPGSYELRAQFDPSVTPSNPAPPISSVPISFVIRPRNAAESEELRVVENIRRGARQSSETALRGAVQWAESRLANDPQNPFVPYVITYGLMDFAARGVRFDRSTDERIKVVRRQLVTLRLDKPSVAVVMDVMRSDLATLRTIADQDRSLAARVANYHVREARSRSSMIRP